MKHDEFELLAKGLGADVVWRKRIAPAHRSIASFLMPGITIQVVFSQGRALAHFVKHTYLGGMSLEEFDKIATRVRHIQELMGAANANHE